MLDFEAVDIVYDGFARVLFEETAQIALGDKEFTAKLVKISDFGVMAADVGGNLGELFAVSGERNLQIF